MLYLLPVPPRKVPLTVLTASPVCYGQRFVCDGTDYPPADLYDDYGLGWGRVEISPRSPALTDRFCVEMQIEPMDEILTRSAGYLPTQREELFRPFWGLAPILREQDVYLTVRGEKNLFGEWLREVLVGGTDPQSEYYWNLHRPCFD